jgi:hypothetical protein
MLLLTVLLLKSSQARESEGASQGGLQPALRQIFTQHLRYIFNHT